MRGFDDDERASAGKVLVLPGAPWGSKPPREPDPAPPPTVLRPEQLSAQARARVLADAVIAALPAETVERCKALAAAYDAARQALTSAERELSSLPDPARLLLDEAETATIRKLTIERMLPGLRDRVRVASEQEGRAVAEARADLGLLAEGGAFRASRAAMADKRQQIQALEREIGELQIGILDARGLLNSWGAESDKHTLRAPAQPPADNHQAQPKKRRGLFG